MQQGLLVTVLMFFTLSFAQAEDYEDCSWKCKKIPPLSKSYELWGEAEYTELPASQFNILVWNLYKGREDDFENEFDDFMSQADIAFLQEATTDRDMQRAYDNTMGAEYHLAISFLMKDDIATGVVTSSRAQAEISQPLRTDHREPFSKSPKMNLVNRFALDNGQKLLVINIHGINFRDKQALQAQYELAKPYMVSHIGPIIFAGDFNTKKDSKLEMTDEWMGQFGMKRITFHNDDRKKKLDNVYYRGLRVNHKQLHEDVKGSDHPAITVQFSAENK